MQQLKNIFRGASASQSRAPIVVSSTHYVLKTDVTRAPRGHDVVVVATGCFWGAEKMFWRLPGVHSTSVGYVGGRAPNPTYEDVCSGSTGHTECVRVTYDPRKVSFADLLAMHWTCHDPTQGDGQGNDRGTQYRSGIYCATDAQFAMAKDSAESVRRGAAGGGEARGDHERNQGTGRRVLLRRGLPPAILGQARKPAVLFGATDGGADARDVARDERGEVWRRILGEVRPETDVHDWRAERTDFVGRRVRGAVNSIDVDRGGVLFRFLLFTRESSISCNRRI